MQVNVQGNVAHVMTGAGGLAAGAVPLLFLHGAALDSDTWREALLHFPDNALAVDLPAHGASGGQPLASVETMADWVAALLDALGLARVRLVGHSLGSLIALDCAARHPDRVAALALVCTSVPMPVNADLLAAAQRDDPLALEMLAGWGVSRGFVEADTPHNREQLAQLTARFRRCRPGVLFRDLSACNDYSMGLTSAEQVHCPVQLVLGAEDRLTPPDRAEPLVAALGSVSVTTLPGVGHSPMVEQPEALWRLIETQEKTW